MNSMIVIMYNEKNKNGYGYWTKTIFLRLTNKQIVLLQRSDIRNINAIMKTIRNSIISYYMKYKSNKPHRLLAIITSIDNFKPKYAKKLKQECLKLKNAKKDDYY